MLAAMNGHDTIVRIVLSNPLTCTKHIELKGTVHTNSGVLVDNVTALWCALDRSHYTVARTLIDLGKANVHNGPFHSLLIDAIVRERLDTVQFLVENGYVDINQTVTNDSNQCSSLIVSVGKGHTQIAVYLISKGADLNFRTLVHQNTPLNVAIIEGHLELVRLLCSAGASTEIRNSNDKTPIVLAAEHDRFDIVKFLLEHNHNETTFNDLELHTCSYITSTNDGTIHRSEKMIPFLRCSLEKRALLNIPKKVQSVAAYGFQQECQSIDEFDRIQHDDDRLYVETLLIRERILISSQNKHTLFKPLLQRVITLAMNGQYEYCLQLAFHTFYLYQQMEIETNLHRFIWIFARMLIAKIPIPVDLFLKTCTLTLEPSQRNSNDAYLKNALCLVVVAAKVLEQSNLSSDDRRSIVQWIRDLCQLQRTTERGQTLLHLSVNVQTYYDINYQQEEVKSVIIFPNLAAATLLIDYGSQWIDLNAIEQVRGETALHILARTTKLSCTTDIEAIVELLISARAHIDCVDNKGKTPLDRATGYGMRTLLQSKQTIYRLKCLCARLIVEHKLAYDLVWPKETRLNKFIHLHGGSRMKS